MKCHFGNETCRVQESHQHLQRHVFEARTTTPGAHLTLTDGQAKGFVISDVPKYKLLPTATITPCAQGPFNPEQLLLPHEQELIHILPLRALLRHTLSIHCLGPD